MEFLRIAGTNKNSTVDGEGLRYTLYVQGCEHKCIGCHNQSTHDLLGGELKSLTDIIKDIELNCLTKKVTISGGDPLHPKNVTVVTELCKRLSLQGYDVCVYTGYTFDNIKHLDVVNYINTLVDGKYEKDLKDLTSTPRGSTNQKIIKLK